MCSSCHHHPRRNPKDVAFGRLRYILRVDPKDVAHWALTLHPGLDLSLPDGYGFVALTLHPGCLATVSLACLVAERYCAFGCGPVALTLHPAGWSASSARVSSPERLPRPPILRLCLRRCCCLTLLDLPSPPSSNGRTCTIHFACWLVLDASVGSVSCRCSTKSFARNPFAHASHCLS